MNAGQNGRSLDLSFAVATDVPATVLGVCASAKPPPGAPGKSAARNYLLRMLDLIVDKCPSVQLLDLRETPLPFFDGRMPEAHDDSNVLLARRSVAQAGALLFAVPAYWSSVGAVFKNFCEVLAGPAYDLNGAPTLFARKPAGLLIVGADAGSAENGAVHASSVLTSLGAQIVARPVIVSDPRGIRSRAALEQLGDELSRLAAATALAGLRTPRER